MKFQKSDLVNRSNVHSSNWNGQSGKLIRSGPVYHWAPPNHHFDWLIISGFSLCKNVEILTILPIWLDKKNFEKVQIGKQILNPSWSDPLD